MISPRGTKCGTTFAICLLGLAIRVFLYELGLQPRLESVMELVVPSASWERAQEGLYLSALGLSPYAGGAFSGSPLMLAVAGLCKMFPAGFRMLGAALLFSLIDLASALLLRDICLHVMSQESRTWETELEDWIEEDSKPPGWTRLPTASASPRASGTRIAQEVKPTAHAGADEGISSALAAGKDNDVRGQASRVEVSVRECQGGISWGLHDAVLAVYYLNPVVAGQCAALSGDVLGRTLPLAAVAAAGRGRPVLAAAALSAATCLYRLNSMLMLVPVALVLSQKVGRVVASGLREATPCEVSRGGERDDGDRGQPAEGNNDETCRRGGSPDGAVSTSRVMEVEFDWKVFVSLCVMFAASCALILGGCWAGGSRSWDFLRAAVAGQLLCEDLTPNPGLYWYFFAEVFTRFRGFFRVLFLSQPYVYVLPVTLRLGMFPEATVSLLLAIFGLFHSCPTLVDPILAGCLFLCHPRTAERMRLVIPLGLVALVPSLLLPTMRHVWLQAGTGNANFYYFQTVALNVLLSVFVLQFVAALVKRRKALAVALRKRRDASLLNREARGGTGMRGCGDR